jgi:hypothetical protein
LTSVFVMKNNGSATTGTVTVVSALERRGRRVISDSTAGGSTIAAGGTGTMTGGCRVVFTSVLSDQHRGPVHIGDQEQRRRNVEGHVQETSRTGPICRWSSCASMTR